MEHARLLEMLEFGTRGKNSSAYEVSYPRASMDGQEGFDFVLKLSRICLRSVGAWPELYESFTARLFSDIQYLITIFVLAFFVNTLQFVQLVHYWGDLDQMTNVLSILNLPILNITYAMIRCWNKRRVLQRLIGMMREDWMRKKSPKEIKLMTASATMARNLSRICVSLGQGACLFFWSMHFYLRHTLDLDYRMYIFDAHSFYDDQVSPNYEITWCIQFFCTFSSTAGFIGFESLFTIIVLHVCGQLACLRERIGNLTRDGEYEYEGLKREIAAIVGRHNYLYSAACEIENVFTSVHLMQLFNFTLIFCLLGYQGVTMIKESEANIVEIIFCIGFFVYLSSNLFVCCYASEQLRSESLAVEFAAYDTCWYNMKPKEAMLLMNVLMRSKIPFEITAGKLFTFSLETFNSLMKTSASYMSVLLAMKSKID